MQNWRESYENVFGEVKNLLAELSGAESYEALLEKENSIHELYQKFAFLKVSRTLESSSLPETSLPLSDHELNVKIEQIETHDLFEDVPEVEEVHSFVEIDATEKAAEPSPIENPQPEDFKLEEDRESQEVDLTEDTEQLISENELESVEAQHFHEDIVEAVEENEAEVEQLLERPAEQLEPMQDSQFSFAMEKEKGSKPAKDDYESRLAEKEARLKELEENRRKIVEFSKDNAQPKNAEMQNQAFYNQDQQDKKFKLANIKGLKITKSLFDDDHLEQLEKPEPVKPSGSLLKNNVPTDYMEAPKPKPEFKLDLNDRIAFSQYLFNGSQSELNDVVNMLNSFTSVEKAQEFLSDIYYEKDWKKVDSYAQRLWTLVENRFL